MPRIGEVIIGFAFAAAVGMVVAAVVFVQNRDDETLATTLNEPVNQEFETSDSPNIEIDSWRGAVTVRANGGTMVTVLIARTGTGETEQEAFDNLTMLESRAVEEPEDNVSILTFRTEDAPAPAGTRAPITVNAPAGSVLDITATGTEPVVVEGFNNDISVDAEGAVTIEVPSGAPVNLDLQTEAGTISNFIELDGGNAPSNDRTVTGSRGSGGATITVRAGAGITIREG